MSNFKFRIGELVEFLDDEEWSCVRLIQSRYAQEGVNYYGFYRDDHQDISEDRLTAWSNKGRKALPKWRS